MSERLLHIQKAQHHISQAIANLQMIGEYENMVEFTAPLERKLSDMEDEASVGLPDADPYETAKEEGAHA
jgi:hypothetical protein